MDVNSSKSINDAEHYYTMADKMSLVTSRMVVLRGYHVPQYKLIQKDTT